MRLLVTLAKEQDATLIVSLHTLDLLVGNFDRVIALGGGAIRWEGPPEQLDRERLCRRGERRPLVKPRAAVVVVVVDDDDDDDDDCIREVIGCADSVATEDVVLVAVVDVDVDVEVEVDDEGGAFVRTNFAAMVDVLVPDGCTAVDVAPLADTTTLVVDVRIVAVLRVVFVVVELEFVLEHFAGAGAGAGAAGNSAVAVPGALRCLHVCILQ